MQGKGRGGGRLILAAVLAAGFSAAGHAQGEFRLKWMARGAGDRIGGFFPKRLTLSSDAPAGVRRLPEKLYRPVFTTLALGPRENPTVFTLLLDTDDSRKPRLFVDSNCNGDLTDDPAPEWIRQTYRGSDGREYAAWRGAAQLPVRYGSRSVSLCIRFRLWDPADPGHALERGTLACTGDYAWEGEVTLDGATYRVMLSETFPTGDYRPQAGSPAPTFWIDVNGNGVFDARGETYDATRPFTIRGATYEISGLEASGETLRVVRSARSVPEILPPPDLSPGRPSPAFQARTTDGKSIRFPADYKGKHVLLHFWSSICGPCVSALPELTRAYSAHHPLGLECLGICMDDPETARGLGRFTREHGMFWPQICDGKGPLSPVPDLYFIRSTPTLLLVDGDTGAILAGGEALRGGRLRQTLDRAMEKRLR